MSDDAKKEAPRPAAPAPLDEDRAAILARRSQFVGASLKDLATPTAAPATPTPATPTPHARHLASPTPCLSVAFPDHWRPAEPPIVELPPPPPDTGLRARIVLAALAPMTAVAAIVAGVPAFAVVSVTLAALAVVSARGRQQAVGASLAMAALDRASRGRFDEARTLLDAVSPALQRTYVGQMVDTQRAALALYEGDLDAAETHATKGAREGQRLSEMGQIHRGSALSLRAVARAALGKKDESLSDVAKLRTARYRQGAFVARAALAEALLFARERDLDSLARVLREERALLLGATGPRERMVVRALARLVAAKKMSVYREPGKRDEEPLGEQASWVARLAPEAAAYATAPKLGAPQAPPARVDPAVAARAEKAAPKAKAARNVRATAALFLVVVFVALFFLLLRADTPVAPEPVSAWWPLAAVLAVAGFLAGLVAYRLSRAKRFAEELSRAVELRLRGLHDEARAALEPLSRDTSMLVAPQAHRELASIATASGDFRGAAAFAEAGIRGVHVSETARSLGRAVLLPQLYGELALALAAEGRIARAAEELERVRVLHADYPFLARDTFRVRLVGLAATARLDEAAELARSRPVDLFLSMQEELLCDALRVHAGDALPEGERERIELEVGEEPRGAFLDRVAPSLRAKRARAVVVPAAEPPPSSHASDDEDEAAEAERALSQSGR